MALKQQNMYFRKKTQKFLLWNTYRYLVTHTLIKVVLGIQIRRIHMFLGLPDPHPDPLVTSTDPDTDPSFIKQK
jgi:hypothetical protein